MPIGRTSPDNNGVHAASRKPENDPWWREREELASPPAPRGNEDPRNELLPSPLSLASGSEGTDELEQSTNTARSHGATSPSHGAASSTTNDNASDFRADGDSDAPQHEVRHGLRNGGNQANVDR